MTMGRPCLLTPEVLEEVAQLLPRVMFLETVAGLIGVTARTIQLWRARGKREEHRLRKRGAEPRESEAIYLGFFRVYKKGLAQSMVCACQCIHDAGESGHWQAAAWFLERRWPELWGRDRRVIADLKRRIAVLERRAGLA